MAGNEAHDWGPPPPGQGRLDVCRKCGQRRTEHAEATLCAPMVTDDPPPITEYDPFED